MGNVLALLKKEKAKEIPLDSPCEVPCPKCGKLSYFGPRVEAVNCFGSDCDAVVYRTTNNGAIKLESEQEAYEKGSKAKFVKDVVRGIQV